MPAIIPKIEPAVIIRTDINEGIGSGHAMRCLTIAKAFEQLGSVVCFAVSDERSSSFFRDRGITTFQLGGDSVAFKQGDGINLAKLCNSQSAVCLLIDSYAITDEFVCSLNACLGSECCTAYIDDDYTFAEGRKGCPNKWDVDCVINYSFYSDKSSLELIYAESNTKLLCGPTYAPINERFVNDERQVSSSINRVLITTGATNPDRSLEKMLEGCVEVLPNASIDVIVGALASFDYPSLPANVQIHQGVSDLSSLMRASDFAISSAGTTLYELCASGLPTLAIPIVPNQLSNVEAFVDHGLGLGILGLNCSSSDITEQLLNVKGNMKALGLYSQQMRKTVDGHGALRIAKSLIG